MQFKVPQFIEREAKIVGPLTFRQFLFVGGGGVIVFILYSTLAQVNTFLFILLTVIVVIISLSFTFLKIEGHPLLSVFLSFTNFVTTPRVYLWERKKFIPKIQKEKPKIELKNDKKEGEEIKIFRQSKLKDLSSEIEIKE